MFLRTERLFLRPPWLEDVPELTHAIGRESVVRMLARAPWPYGEGDARRWVEQPRNPYLPSLLVTLPDQDGRIVGGCSLDDGESVPEVGYWIAPEYWGRGYATEALDGLLSLARMAGHRRVLGRRAADNPASGQVLRKAGFRPTGRSGAFHSLSRNAGVEALEYAIDLCHVHGPCNAPMPKAA